MTETQKNIRLIVTYTLFEGKREAFYQTINEAGIPQASRAEKGCYAYAYYFSAENPDELLLIEKWQDQASLDAHKLTKHFLELQDLKKDFVKEAKLLIDFVDA